MLITLYLGIDLYSTSVHVREKTKNNVYSEHHDLYAIADAEMVVALKQLCCRWMMMNGERFAGDMQLVNQCSWMCL